MDRISELATAFADLWPCRTTLGLQAEPRTPIGSRMEQEQLDRQREYLLNRLRDAGISDRVCGALIAVPRHRFVPAELAARAWEDTSLPIGSGQTISQPSLVARMLEQLQTRPEDTVLDIGTGSGYQAAVLANLVRRVVGVERMPELRRQASERLKELGYSNVQVFDAGETLGKPDMAPFDGIIVGAASPSVPKTLADQLAVGGRLVIPVGRAEQQTVRLVERTETGFKETKLDPVVFVPLIGEGAWDTPTRDLD